MAALSLYAWGANSYGQLGTGDTIDRLLPTEVRLPCVTVENAVPQAVDWVAAGGGHTVLSIGKNKLVACGWNNKGQLGIGRGESQLTSFEAVETPQGVTFKSASCGWDFTLAVSGTDKLWAWGSNTFGQLGIARSTLAFSRLPVEVPINPVADTLPVCVIQAVTGLRHAVILTDDGSVYTSGAGKKGQLGPTIDEGNTIRQDSKLSNGARDCFKKVMMPPLTGHIVQVIAGSYHTAILTDDSKLLFWGSNEHGQLYGEPLRCVLMPVPINFELAISITSCASGWTHLAVLTDKKTVCTWGRNDYGQLGRQRTDVAVRHDSTPRELPIADAKKVVCGAEHTLVLTEDGTLFGFGFNEHGMCATGGSSYCYTPSRAGFFKENDKVVFDVASGCGHVMALACSHRR